MLKSHFGWWAILLVARLAAQNVPPAPSLEGTVVNSVTGQLIAGARLKLNLEPPVYTRSDANGHFAFPDMAPRLYSLTAEAPGTPPQVTQVRAPAASVRIALTPRAVITGRLTDPNGLPFPYTVVQVFSASQNPSDSSRLTPRGRASPDDRGEFSVALEPGAYYLMAGEGDPNAWDKSYRNTYYPHTADAASAKPIQIGPGETVRADLQIGQWTGVRLTGRVQHPPLPAADGNTNSGMYVFLRPVQDVTNSGPTASVNDDRYEFGNLLPGKYTLFAVAFSGQSGPVFGAQQAIEIGARDSEADVTLAPLAPISGTVSFAPGCAPLPLRMTILNYPWGNAPATAVGPDGEFTISGLHPGKVNLQFVQAMPASAGAPVFRAASLGDRDALRGFEYPLAKAEKLRITVGCAGRLP